MVNQLDGTVVDIEMYNGNILAYVLAYDHSIPEGGMAVFNLNPDGYGLDTWTR